MRPHILLFIPFGSRFQCVNLLSVCEHQIQLVTLEFAEVTQPGVTCKQASSTVSAFLIYDSVEMFLYWNLDFS